MRHSLVAFLLSALLLVAAQVSAQTVYTFTAAGATGSTGPDQAMLDSAYSGTSLDGQVTSVGGIQHWTVPASGRYLIEAYGGQGYGDFGGRGAHISGVFTLNGGDALKVLVGQMAGPYLNFPDTTYNHQYGGGGGSFVTYSDNSPLVVAGGGGGSHASSFVSTADGQITTSGAPGTLAIFTGIGGTAGSGGAEASSADGGAGLLDDGDGIAGGQAFVNGGLGGFDEGFGGFGGGGGTSSWNNYRGGGGGGYSGGGGANNGGDNSAGGTAGGGGGSFNAGINQVNLPGVQLGDGLVKITLLGPAFTMTFSPSSLVLGETSTLTYVIDNTVSAVDGNGLDFTNDLPAGLAIAAVANAATTCAGGTLTAVAGTAQVAYTGGTVAAGGSCTVSVDVSPSITSSLLNTTGDLTSSIGNSGSASATLDVAAPPPPPPPPPPEPPAAIPVLPFPLLLLLSCLVVGLAWGPTKQVRRMG